MENINNLKDFKIIYDAITKYITINSTFESNIAIDNVIKKIQQVNSIEDIFKIPIDNRLYNFKNSLEWLYFICFIIYTINDEKFILPNNFNMIFSTNDAIIYISNIYDAANETFYQDYINIEQ
jgi:hypothetical protein